MFSFLSRPKPSLRSQFSLVLYKALFLSLLFVVTFSLLIARPAHAQGYWYPVPCDAAGTPLSYPSYDSSTGYYALSGTQDWTASYVYPGDVIAAAKAYPDGNSNALSAVSPLDIWANPSTKLGVRAAGGLGGSGGAGNLFSLSGSEGPSRAYAANLPANSYPWWYRVYVGGSYYSGYLNGSAAVDITGHLVYYFKMQWQGGPSLDAQKPPDHLNLLLRTNVTASASVSRDPSAESLDLWARSMATDGSPFGETATAAAGVNAKNEAVTVSGPDHVLGYHLVRAAVDPLTRVAKVAVDGHLTWEASDGVRYGTLEYPTSDKSYPLAKGKNGPTSATASGSIEAAVKQDNREVTISYPSLEPNFHVGPLDPVTNAYPQNVRASDGSMHVDSVARAGISGHWKNSAGLSTTLIANTPNFTNPYYLWSKSGTGTVDSQTATGLGVKQQLLNSIVMNLDFGTEPNKTSDPNTVVAKNPFPMSTTVRVDVTDGPTATYPAVGANTYTIAYHMPFENPKKFGLEVKDDTIYKQVVSTIPNALASIPIPARVVSVDLAGGAHIAGGVATAAAAGLPLITVVADVAQPELIVGQIILASFGYALGLYPDAKSENDVVPIGTNYAEFKKDVEHQVLINQQPVGQKDKVRFEPADLAEIIAAQLQSDPAKWQQDPYFNPDPLKAQLTLSSQAFRVARRQQVVGDGYGLHGYAGPQYHTVRAEGDYYTVTHWTYVSAQTVPGQ